MDSIDNNYSRDRTDIMDRMDCMDNMDIMKPTNTRVGMDCANCTASMDSVD